MAPGLRDKLMIAACVAASVGAALAVQLKAAGELCYPIDDGWVYCVYARNLAEGHGYSFNEGDHFVCGTTSLLWPLLLTPCYWLFRDCMAPAEALGAIFLLFTCILVHKIARKILAHAQPRDFLTQHGRNQRPQHEGHEVGPSSSCPSPFFVSFASFVNFVSGRRAVRSHDHFGNDFTGKGLRSPHDPAAPAAGASALPLRPSAGDARWADRLSVLIPVFLAFSGFIAWSVLSGMETMLFTFLTVASVWYRLKHPDWRSKRYLIASAMAAVSGLARPEGFLLAGMFMADSVICRFVGAPSQDEGQLDRRVGRSLTCQLALLGLVLIPYVTVNYLSCSMPFPTSFMVEPPLTQSLFFTFQTGAWGTYVMHLARALPRWLADLARVFGAENVLLLLLLPVGAVATLRQARRTPHGSGSLILPLLVLAYPLVRAVFLNSHVLGQAARHVHNLMPLFYLLAGVALLGLTNGWRGAASGCALGAAGVCAVFGLARALDDFLRARLSLPSLGVQHMAPALWVSGLALIAIWLVRRQNWALRLEDALLRWRAPRPSADGGHPSPPALRLPAVLGVVMLTAVAVFVALRFVGCRGGVPHGLARYYGYVKNTAEMHITLARWVAQHTPKDAAVAMFDKEAMKWYSRRRVIHLGGRTNPEAMAHRQRYEDWDRAALSYLATCRPEYLIIGPDVHRWLGRQRRLIEEVHRVFLEDRVHIWENPQVVYRINWQAYDLVYGQAR